MTTITRQTSDIGSVTTKARSRTGAARLVCVARRGFDMHWPSVHPRCPRFDSGASHNSKQALCVESSLGARSPAVGPSDDDHRGDRLTVEVQATQEYGAVDTSGVVRDALPVPLLGCLPVSREVLVSVRQPAEARPHELCAFRQRGPGVVEAAITTHGWGKASRSTGRTDGSRGVKAEEEGSIAVGTRREEEQGLKGFRGEGTSIPGSDP